MRNKRVFILSGILAILTGILLAMHMPKTPIQGDGIRNTFNATCIVGNGSAKLGLIIPMGTGIVLDTGFILTARHVVDINGNNKLEANERDLVVQFKYGGLHPVRVAYFGKKDFALLMPDLDFSLRPSVKASRRNSVLAEKIHTVGATAGQSLHVTTGHISMPYGGRGRASCYISGGNSGGAIVDENNEHLGVVVAVGLRHAFLRAQSVLTIKNKSYMSNTVLHVRDEVGSLCFYVPIKQVRSEIADKNLGHLLDVLPQQPLLDSLYGPFMAGGLTLLYQIILFLLAVFYVRRHLFS
jgi:hypothetical protein